MFEERIRKQEKIESDLESLIFEAKEFLGAYSERSSHFRWGEKEEIEEGLKQSQDVIENAGTGNLTYDEWEDSYNSLQKALDKPLNRYLNAVGQAPKEASRRHKTKDAEKKETLYPESKVTFQEKLSGVAVLFLIGFGIYVGLPAVKKAMQKKKGNKLGGRTLKQLQEQAKLQKVD